jgi:hypothetical protein
MRAQRNLQRRVNTLAVKKETPAQKNRGFDKVGNDLLSHKCSTIGADGLNFSVRNGKRWFPVAIVTLRHSIGFDVKEREKIFNSVQRKLTGN